MPNFTTIFSCLMLQDQAIKLFVSDLQLLI